MSSPLVLQFAKVSDTLAPRVANSLLRRVSDTCWSNGLGVAVAAAAAAVVLAACGNGGSRPSQSAAREWTANANGVIDQLRSDTVAASDGDNSRSARAALHDESRLYGLLVAYSDFGGCNHMVAAVGEPPPNLRSVRATLTRVCTDLQRAAALFTRAAARSDAGALVAAARVVRIAAPLIDRSALELRAASAGR